MFVYPIVFNPQIYRPGLNSSPSSGVEFSTPMPAIALHINCVYLNK